jgi:hypothetical protein
MSSRYYFLMTVALCFSGAARADVILNYAPTALGINQIAGDISPNNGTGWMAAGFTMPAGQSYELTDILVQVQDQGPRSSGATTTAPLASIWSDATGRPGTQLYQLTEIGTAAAGNLNYDATTSFVLTGGTTYWVELSDFPKQQARWLSYGPGAFSGVAAYAGLVELANSGSTVTNGPGWLPILTINGTAVANSPNTDIPEPASLALLGAGLSTIGVARHRRRRGAAAG